MSRVVQMVAKTLLPRKAVPGKSILEPSVTKLRVNVLDLDMLFHVNNGIYLQMADVARWDYLSDLDGMAKLRNKRWYPVVAAASVKYKRSMKLGEKITITTRVLGWDERCVYLEQVFTSQGGSLHATAWIAARFLQVGGERVAMPDVLELLSDGPVPPSPDLPTEVANWARAVDVAPRATE